MRVMDYELEEKHGLGLCGISVGTGHDEKAFSLTGGCDGRLLLSYASEDESTKELDVEFEIHAVAISPSNDVIAIGCADYIVRSYSIPDLEYLLNITRFTARVRGIAYSACGSKLAICSEEPGIRVLHSKMPEKFITLAEHDGGVKSIAWDPKGFFLASVGFDGNVKVWGVNPELDELLCDCETTVVKCTAKESPANGSASAWGSNGSDQLSWHPNGNFLSLPGSTKVRLLCRNTWEISSIDSTSGSGHVLPICASIFLPDGHHLITTCTGCKVIMWHIDSKIAIRTWQPGQSVPEAVICSLQWLKLTESDGALLIQTVQGSTGKIHPHVVPDGESDNFYDIPVSNLMDDEAMEVGSKSGSGDEMEEGGFEPHAGLSKSLADEIHQAVLRAQEPVTKAQPAFQPGATPPNARRRYLCWNSVGTVVSVDEGAYNSIEVEFTDLKTGRKKRFQDSWKFSIGSLGVSGAVFANAPSYDKLIDDDMNDGTNKNKKSRSVLYFVPLGIRTTGLAWTKILPQGETAVSVATGSSWVAVVTVKNILRLYTISGLQGDVIRIPGAPVCMVGNGSLLGLVYHAGPPYSGSQNLGFWILDTNSGTRIAEGRLGLTPDSELTWAGFSTEGMFCCMDSKGAVMGIVPSYGWTPLVLLQTKCAEIEEEVIDIDGAVVDSAFSSRNRLWPLSVTESHLIAVALKGAEKQPVTFPRPVVTEVALAIPPSRGQEGVIVDRFEASLMLSQAKLLLREAMRKANIQQEHSGVIDDDDSSDEAEKTRLHAKALAEIDRGILKAIQEALSKKNENRAEDLAQRLNLEKSHTIAIKLANHHNMNVLAAVIDARIDIKFRSKFPEKSVIDSGSDHETGAGWRRALRLNSDKAAFKPGPIEKLVISQSSRQISYTPVKIDVANQHESMDISNETIPTSMHSNANGTKVSIAESSGNESNPEMSTTRVEEPSTPEKPKKFLNPFKSHHVLTSTEKRDRAVEILGGTLSSPVSAKKMRPILQKQRFDELKNSLI